MLDFNEEGKVVTLIVDISLRHSKNDRRNIDVVKEKILEFRNQCIYDEKDSLYIYDPFDLNPTVHSDRSMQTKLISELDSVMEFNIYYGIKQAIYLYALEDFLCSKHIIIISDRMNTAKYIKKGLLFNDKENMEANIVLLTLGSNNNLEEIKKLEKSNFFHIHFDDAELIDFSLIGDNNGNW